MRSRFTRSLPSSRRETVTDAAAIAAAEIAVAAIRGVVAAKKMRGGDAPFSLSFSNCNSSLTETIRPCRDISRTPDSRLSETGDRNSLQGKRCRDPNCSNRAEREAEYRSFYFSFYNFLPLSTKHPILSPFHRYIICAYDDIYERA